MASRSASIRSRLSAIAATPERSHSFPPVIHEGARTLILGSMPGALSLAAQQYYAHPYNQFWKIMATLYEAGFELAYERRLERLQAQGVALWDVLASCVRVGSLDSAIEHASAIANDIPGLLRRYPSLERLCCNGTAAYAALQRHFGAELAHTAPQLKIHRLPSTSPANAGWSPERKLAAWQEALRL